MKDRFHYKFVLKSVQNDGLNGKILQIYMLHY